MTLNTNLPVMVFIDFKICLPTKKKIKPNTKAKPKTLCSSQFESKNLYFRVFESESTLFEPKNFIPDNQDPIFAGYGYNLHVIFIYVWTPDTGHLTHDMRHVVGG